MRYDFSQAMRFRRALINDVFLALQKAGHIKEVFAAPGAPGTPSSAQQCGKRIGTSSKYIRGPLIMYVDAGDRGSAYENGQETLRARRYIRHP